MCRSVCLSFLHPLSLCSALCFFFFPPLFSLLFPASSHSLTSSLSLCLHLLLPLCVRSHEPPFVSVFLPPFSPPSPCLSPSPPSLPPAFLPAVPVCPWPQVPPWCLAPLPPSLSAGLSASSLPRPASSVSPSPCLSLALFSGKAAVIYELRTGPAAGAGGPDYSFPEEAACSGMAG